MSCLTWRAPYSGACALKMLSERGRKKVPLRKSERALLAMGILLVIIGSVLLAWNILADPYVLTVFDGQWASITREGKEFKFMYDANSSWITQTGGFGWK
jgi:hypothetical protein